MAASAQQKQENLNSVKTLDFMEQSFRNGEIKESGTAIVEVLPPMVFFGSAGAQRAEKKSNVLRKLKEYFDRFYDISGGVFLGGE